MESTKVAQLNLADRWATVYLHFHKMLNPTSLRWIRMSSYIVR